MASNRNKHHPEDDFNSYRQVAPESLSDESLRVLIKSKENKKEAILKAIENIWHDIPDQQAVGSEWQTTSKKAKETPAPVRGSTRQGDGGRGGGRNSRQSTGGRGNGAEKGDRKRENRNVTSTPPVADPSPAPVEVSSPVVVETVDPVVPQVAQVNTQKPSVKPVPVIASAPTSTVSATGKPAWGTGTSFVQQMKNNEVEKAKAAVAALAALEAQKALEAVVVPIVSESGVESSDAKDTKKKDPRPRTRKPRGPNSGKKSPEANESEDVVKGEDVESVPVVETPVAVANNESIELTAANSDINASAESFAPASSLENANLDSTNGFLKLGKWEAPVASSEMFQFGSFGNFVQEEDKSVNAWGKTAEDTVSSVVQEESAWNAASEPVNLTSTLFAQSKISDAPSTRAPPGLEQSSNANKQQQAGSNLRVGAPAAVAGGAQKFNKDYQQPQSQQIPPQPIIYNQYAPPGIAPGVSNRNVLGNTAVPNNYPAYNPGFDLAAQSQFFQSNFAPSAVAPPAPANNTAAASAPPALTQAQSSVTTQQQQQAAAAAAAQQQYNPAYFPYYNNNPYNPYNPYPYNQPPNFYGQNGRGLYQQQRPYNDPYGSNSAYPDWNQSQFQDASVYGSNNANPNANALGATAGGNNNNKANKTNPGSSNPAVGGGQNIPQDHNAAHNYGNPYYNRPMDPAAWQYQNQQAAWGGHMMFAPNTAAPTGLNANPGFAQPHLGNPQGPPANSQAGAQRSQGANNNYGSLPGSRNNAGVSGATSNTGTQW